MRTDAEHEIWLENKTRHEQERKEKTIVNWPTTNYFKEIEKFSPRISKVLRTLRCPEREKIQSTYIYGINGSGKTIHAARMIIANCFYADAEPDATSPNYLFSSAVQIMAELKMSYNNRVDFPTEMEIIKKYSEISILVLDDLGVEVVSDWAYQHLYLIIDNRYEADLVTIFTSNFSLSELSEKLKDDRIPRRIGEMCKIMQRSFTPGHNAD
jgi:DNA replication protein DnaC